MDLFFQLAERFGLTFALMAIAVFALAKTIEIILKGTLVVPRWVYDQEREAHRETKALLRRAVPGLEQAAATTAKAVEKAVGKQ